MQMQGRREDILASVITAAATAFATVAIQTTANLIEDAQKRARDKKAKEEPPDTAR